jgi:hypothetical protein
MNLIEAIREFDEVLITRSHGPTSSASLANG